jgi:hypothetical protein
MPQNDSQQNDNQQNDTNVIWHRAKLCPSKLQFQKAQKITRLPISK